MPRSAPALRRHPRSASLHHGSPQASPGKRFNRYQRYLTDWDDWYQAVLLQSQIAAVRHHSLSKNGII
jgi:hypothetical protein